MVLRKLNKLETCPPYTFLYARPLPFSRTSRTWTRVRAPSFFFFFSFSSFFCEIFIRRRARGKEREKKKKERKEERTRERAIERSPSTKEESSRAFQRESFNGNVNWEASAEHRGHSRATLPGCRISI